MKNNKGFTLIELMITVAIVGVLAAIALPAYQDYTIKAQVSEGLLMAGGSKTSVVEYYAQKGVLPTSGSTIGYNSQTGKYITGTTIENGSITATFGNNSNTKIHNNYVKLIPTETNSNLTWACQSDLPSKYLPTSCATGGSIVADNGSGNTGSTGNGNTGSSGTGSNTGNTTTPPVSTAGTDGKTLTDAQKSKYPEVDAAYKRFFDSAGQVAQFQANAASLQAQAQAAQASGDMNKYNQLIGQANNEAQQANNYSTQMNQAQTQYNQAIDVYKGRNSGTLPGDFPVAPKA